MLHPAAKLSFASKLHCGQQRCNRAPASSEQVIPIVKRSRENVLELEEKGGLEPPTNGLTGKRLIAEHSLYNEYNTLLYQLSYLSGYPAP